jgi:hypothetical protein
MSGCCATSSSTSNTYGCPFGTTAYTSGPQFCSGPVGSQSTCMVGYTCQQSSTMGITICCGASSSTSFQGATSTWMHVGSWLIG